MKSVFQVGIAMLLVWGAAWVTMLTLPERAETIPPQPAVRATPDAPTPPRPEGESFRRDRQPPEGTRIERDITYAVVAKRELKLDLYLPPVDPQAQLRTSDDARYPLVIYVHGSAMRPSSKERVPLFHLLSQGFAVASVDYRTAAQAPFPAGLHDCQAAVRFLRAHANDYQLDPNRFGAYGSSLGGQLVALLGTTGDAPELADASNPTPTVSAALQAVVIYATPTDLTALLPLYRPDDPTDAAAALLQFMDPTSADRLEQAKCASPLTYVSSQDPPFLVLHNIEDSLVPLSQAQTFADALLTAGGQAKLLVLPAGSTGSRSFFSSTGRQAAADFFRTHLRPDAPTTAPAAIITGP